MSAAKATDTPAATGPAGAAPTALAADLVPFIGDPSAFLILARVAGVGAVAQDGGVWEQGTVRLTVVEVFRGERLRAGDTLAVPFVRMAGQELRARNPENNWNNLDLSPGSLMIIACRPAAPAPATGPATRPAEPQPWAAVAAQQVAAADDPAVADVRRAVQIEALPPDRRVHPLQDALIESDGLLRRYAIDAIAARHVVPRAAAVDMLDNAINSPRADRDAKLALAEPLVTDDLFRAPPAVDPVNVHVVSVLAHGLVTEPDPERRMMWVKFLSSQVMQEFSEDPKADRAARQELVRAVRTPPPKQILGMLLVQAEHGSPAEQTLTRDLSNVWHEAAAAQR
ncbi:MAG TPA: hypothetical protein VGI81_22750 [Tepidisphaeraceae bacterium]